jgi:hypothetical protein
MIRSLMELAVKVQYDEKGEQKSNMKDASVPKPFNFPSRGLAPPASDVSLHVGGPCEVLKQFSYPVTTVS